MATGATLQSLPPPVESKLAKKFIKSLATQLATDSSVDLLSASDASLKEFARKAAEDLPAGRLRSSLLLILQDPGQLDTFVAFLRENVRSAGLLRQPADASCASVKDKDFERISSWFADSSLSAFSFLSTSNDASISREGRQIILFQDPPANIIWSLAALELPSHISSFGTGALTLPNSAKALLICLKSLIVGHRSPLVAIATLAPLVPLMLQCLQQTKNTPLDGSKLLRATVKEALSFISVINGKDKREGTDAGKVFVNDLLDIFSSIFQVLKLEVHLEQIEAQSLEAKLRLVFPLVPMELIDKMSKHEVAVIKVVAKMVKIQLIVLQTVSEVLYRKSRVQVQEKSKKIPIVELTRMVGFVAVNGLAAAEGDNELLLDLLLSGFSVGHIVNEEEMNIIVLSLFKALVISNQRFIGSPAPKTARAKKKEISKFFKKIMVARMILGKRLNGDSQNYVEEVTNKIFVPHCFVEYLNSKQTLKPPENALHNERSLIGWLLKLADGKFQTLLEGSSNSCIKEDARIKKKEHSELAGPLVVKDIFHEAENLFFLDTAGEKESNAGEGDLDTVDNANAKKKSRKRKERKIHFRRHAHLMGEEKLDCPLDQEKDEISSHSSSDELVSDIEDSESKRHKGVSENSG